MVRVHFPRRIHGLCAMLAPALIGAKPAFASGVQTRVERSDELKTRFIHRRAGIGCHGRVGSFLAVG